MKDRVARHVIFKLLLLIFLAVVIGFYIYYFP